MIMKFRLYLARLLIGKRAVIFNVKAKGIQISEGHDIRIEGCTFQP